MGSILSLANSDFSSIASCFFCFIGNYFGHCRIYNYKMKTDLKTGSYSNGSSGTEPCWTVPNSSSTTSCPYGRENKENAANLYNNCKNSVGYTSSNHVIILHNNQKNEFTPNVKSCVVESEKSPESRKNGLNIQYQPSDEKKSDLPTKKSSPTTNDRKSNTTLFPTMTCTSDNNTTTNSDTRSSNCKDSVSGWSNILDKMSVIKEMNRPIINTRCSDNNSRQRQQQPPNGTTTRPSFTQLLQKNIQEAVRNFSWWSSGYVHENFNCFSSAPVPPYTPQNRGQHMFNRTSPPLDYYRPVKEMRYPCQPNYMPSFCYNSPDRHCPPQPLKQHPPRFCGVKNPMVGQAGYPGSNYTKGDCRSPPKRPNCPNNGYTSKGDWSKSKNRQLFEKTHWFSETAKENYKINESTKVKFATPKRIEVYSILVKEPNVTSDMSPVICVDDSPLPSTLYSTQQQNHHQEEILDHKKGNTCNTPEAAMFSPVHWATSGNLAANSRQMLDLPVKRNKEKDSFQTGSIVSDDDDSNFSDMVLNCSSSSENDCVAAKERGERDSFSEEEEEEEEKSDGDESDMDLCRCPPHRTSRVAHHCFPDTGEEDDDDSDSGAESDSDSDADDEVDGLAVFEDSGDDLEAVGSGPFKLVTCEDSEDDLETDGETVEFEISVCEDSDEDEDDLETDGGPIEFESVTRCEDSDDDLETDGGPFAVVTVCECEDSEDEIDGGPVKFGLAVYGDDSEDDDLETDGCPVKFGLSVLDGGPDDFRICSMANSWLIKPDSDCEDSEDDDSLAQEDEDDDWDTTWSSSSATPVVPPNEIDLMDEFNNFTLSTLTLTNCCSSFGEDNNKADVPGFVDEVDGGNVQRLKALKEANERWNKVYNDDDDDQGFTIDDNHPKKVQFACGKDLSTVHLLYCWTYAYRAARKGPWISLSLDSQRFRKRINGLKSIIDPVLDPIHRQNVYTSRILQTAEKST